MVDSDELSSASVAGDGGSSPSAARAWRCSTAPSCLYRGACRSAAEAIQSRGHGKRLSCIAAQQGDASPEQLHAKLMSPSIGVHVSHQSVSPLEHAVRSDGIALGDEVITRVERRVDLEFPIRRLACSDERDPIALPRVRRLADIAEHPRAEVHAQ